MSKTLVTKNFPEGRPWPSTITLDVGSSFPTDVYGIRDQGPGVLYIRHDIAAADRKRMDWLLANSHIKVGEIYLTSRESLDAAIAANDKLKNAGPRTPDVRES